MTVKILTINVEISDQYGTSENKLVGVFDDDAKLGEAIKHQERKYRTRRTVIKIDEVLLNVMMNE